MEKKYEQALIYNEDRTRDMILLTAEKRYLKLIKTQLDIIQNISSNTLLPTLVLNPKV